MGRSHRNGARETNLCVQTCIRLWMSLPSSDSELPDSTASGQTNYRGEIEVSYLPRKALPRLPFPLDLGMGTYWSSCFLSSLQRRLRVIFVFLQILDQAGRALFQIHDQSLLEYRDYSRIQRLVCQFRICDVGHSFAWPYSLSLQTRSFVLPITLPTLRSLRVASHRHDLNSSRAFTTVAVAITSVRGLSRPAKVEGIVAQSARH